MSPISRWAVLFLYIGENNIFFCLLFWGKPGSQTRNKTLVLFCLYLYTEMKVYPCLLYYMRHYDYYKINSASSLEMRKIHIFHLFNYYSKLNSKTLYKPCFTVGQVEHWIQKAPHLMTLLHLLRGMLVSYCKTCRDFFYDCWSHVFITNLLMSCSYVKYPFFF